MRSFKKLVYSLEELRQELKEDKKRWHRFPVRFILVEGASNWENIIALLEDMAGTSLKLSEFCSGRDTIPNLDILETKINSLSGKKDLLVLPLDNCLRLFPDRGSMLKKLAIIEKSGKDGQGTKQRVYVPLFESENMFLRQMQDLSRFHELGECAECYYIKGIIGENSKIKLKVVSPHVEASLLGANVIYGVKKHMQIWEKKARINSVLSTKFVQQIEEASGNYSIALFRNSFELLANYGNDYGKLATEWGSDEQWKWLASSREKGERLDDLFLRIFNLATFNAGNLFTRWQEYDSYEKWLLWIWCKLKQPDGYLGYIIKTSSTFNLFEEDSINAIFVVNSDKEKITQDILRERKEILKNLGIQSLPYTFWEKFNLIDNNVDKLKCLACITDEEKYRAIEIIKELLKSSIDEGKWYDSLATIYPELTYYICVADYGNQTVYDYFYNYVRSKLADDVTGKMKKLVQSTINKQIWDYSTRNSLIQSASKQTMFYWADGAGAEWLGLMEGILADEFKDTTYEYKIARANLPTTTEYNKDWQGEDQENHRQYKGYDETIHSYTCKYPQYIVEEFNHIKEIVKKAVSLLESNSTVIITADHGSSRLAVINRQQSISLPKEIKVEKHGRYCINDGSLDANDYKECVEKDDKLIFATYGRFSSSGYVAGEIHGGATLEEVLVPVITLQKKRSEVGVITFVLEETTIKLNSKNEAVLIFTLNSPVKKLILQLGSVRVAAQFKNNRWQVVLKNLKSGPYKGVLWADNSNIGEVIFEIKKGISIDDLGL